MFIIVKYSYCLYIIYFQSIMMNIIIINYIHLHIDYLFSLYYYYYYYSFIKLTQFFTIFVTIVLELNYSH